jgi:CRP-like cAMP-binding protein
LAAETDDAFQQLTDAELAALAPLGVRRAVSAGEYLYREGDAGYDFYVVLAGAVEIVVNSDGKERVIARHTPGRFLGELNLLTGQRVYVSARVAEAGDVLAISRDAFRRVIATDASLSDKILAAFLARRAILLTGASSAIRVIGSRFSPDSNRVREFWFAIESRTSGWTWTPRATSSGSCESSRSPHGTCPLSSSQGRCCAARLRVFCPTTSGSRSARYRTAASI